MRLVVLGDRVGHLAQNLLGEGAQNRELVEERRVEHHIGILLIGEDVFLLAAAHRAPALQRCHGTVAAHAVVADHATQQTVVGRRDAREVIHRYGGEAGDVDAELLAIGNAWREARIEAVDTLDDQDRPLAESERLLVPLPFSGDEVVARNLDLLARNEATEVVVEEREVDRFEGFVVILALFVPRGLLALHEVVVEGDEYGVEAQHAELHGQPLRGGGLSARRGARDQHQPHIVAFVGLLDRVGDVGKFALVERLAHLDHRAGLACGSATIDRSDGREAHHLNPRLILVEDGRHLLLMGLAGEPIGVGAERQQEVKTVEVGGQIEGREVGRRGGKCAIEVTHRIAHRVQGAV